MQQYPWELLSVTVHSAGVYECGPDWSIPYRQNPFTAIWYLAKGVIRLQIGGESVTASAGEALILPTGLPFSAVFAEGCDEQVTVACRFTCFSGEGLDWFTLYRLPYLVDADTAGGLSEAMRRIVGLTGPDLYPASRIEANALMLGILGRIITRRIEDVVPFGNRDSAKQAKVIRLIGWMEEHMPERITLSDLAGLIHVSSDYVNDLFRSVMGEPPMQYLNRLRVNRAKQLLVQGELTVKEISERIGIPDALYFSKLFKKTVGIPPSQYQRAHQQL